MNMPGFTAAASLYKESERYRTVDHPAAAQAAHAGVYPQIRDRPTGRWSGPCIPNCICVGPDECPCCGSLPVTGELPYYVRWT